MAEKFITVVKYLGQKHEFGPTVSTGAFKYPEELDKAVDLAVDLKKGLKIPVYIRNCNSKSLLPWEERQS